MEPVGLGSLDNLKGELDLGRSERVRESGTFKYGTRKADIRTILIRLGAILSIVILISLVVYFRDNSSGEDQYVYNGDEGRGNLTLADSVYFTVISITTTGYGDIVPVSHEAKVFDTIFLTLGRAMVWIILVGTAYQLVFDRYKEAILMKSVQKGLSGHVIVCGYSTTGRTVVEELIAKDWKKKRILIITNEDEAAQSAADGGFISLRGDPSREDVLRSAEIAKASSMILTDGRDDTNVLIVLTAKYLNPDLLVISQVTELENTKLLKKSGVEVIITPAVNSGSLMATALSQPEAVHFLEDIMTARTGLFVNQRVVDQDEVGKKISRITDLQLLGVVRKDVVLSMADLKETRLKDGDILLFIDRK